MREHTLRGKEEGGWGGLGCGAGREGDSMQNVNNQYSC